MISCIILDDEPFAHQVLEHYISQVPDLVLTAKFRNAVEAFEFLGKTTVNLLFLDIEMPLVNGLSFLAALQQPPATIFTTAYKQYAYEGFELHAVDYLLKPFSFERFQKAIDKTGLLHHKVIHQTIAIKDDYGIINLRQDEILYIEGMKDYIRITTAAQVYTIYHTLKAMLDKLDQALFLQAHRSYIVNRSHIRRVSQEMLVLSNQTFIPIGKSFKKELLLILKHE
ncbi:LytTR family DNA-binding domain-containing protein [Pedobacter sp. PLR]|uniref:LytR/AlgR family response regulator transcription factor n=1 Tax=Pedobacter sp. PLR TaxID=2994465 RepID=UPI0022451012|nr:LytTR family DNA-binding domain-containing protein [Pedobacter sp. PLR]MCX2451588.1 LytTR family DNA-binding domain-containing protein [Pedobacter sp. PLR]